MATNQLALYNIALFALGERRIVDLTDTNEPKLLLDEVWDWGEGLIKTVLEQGYWNIAIRAVQIDSSPSLTPSFGYNFGFDVPSDFVRLVQMSGGEFFTDPLIRFEREADIWFANIDPLFVRYISDDASFGNDLSKWPESMTRWVGHYLATQIAPALKNDTDMEALEKRTLRLLVDARSKDAAQEPPRWPPLSSWARARFGRYSGRRDRGSRSNLLG